MAIHIDPDVIQAINKNVTPAFNRYAKKNYGISGKKLLAKVTAGESGGTMHGAVSSAGARGAFQFIPSTRAAYIKQYHVDPWANADQAAKAAIIHIMGTGLSGYNPGMPTYTSYILGQQIDSGSLHALRVGGDGGGAAPSAKIVKGTSSKVTGQGAHMDTKGFLLDYLRDQSPGKSLGGSYLQARTSGVYDVPSTLTVEHGKNKRVSGGGAPGNYLDKGELGKVLGRPIDRPGVATKQQVIHFVRRIAGIYGHPIALGTGTQHNQMTVSGNVSDHWSGHALDLPASGKTLIAMGQAALIAAGMAPAKARKITGGLFNVGGHQIIFNTQEGGDHTDHLHVSAY